MVRQPDRVSPILLERARDGARAKVLPARSLRRSLVLDEGRCVQVLHVGTDDDEDRCCGRCTATSCRSTA